MGYPPETMNAFNGMALPHSPHGARRLNNQNHLHPYYPTYHGNPTFQIPPQAGHLPNNYLSASYAPVSGMHQQTQPFPNTQSPFHQKTSGVAVVIPSPSARDVQRTSSMPIAPRQQTENAQRTVSTPTTIPRASLSASAASRNPSVDHPLLLLSLAEENLAAARGQAYSRTLKDRSSNMRQYYKLLATGLACLETVLKRFKVQPQVEASVRLRYASVLYEETENMLEAEQCLSEGIKLCDRYRFFDLKYNMEHLLAQVLFKGSPRAAMKFLDGVIKDAGAYQHTAWIYALRFLKISLLLQLSTHQDTVSSLSQLRSISTLADRTGDKAILAIVSTLEALVHLRQSSSAESIEQAQRALALARSLQHDPVVGPISQLALLINIADLSCSLQQFDPTQAVPKMQAMQALLEGPRDDWNEDGTFSLPVSSQDASRAPHGNGIVRKDLTGSVSVRFSWAPWTDLYMLGYLLSSMSLAHRNTTDGLRSEQMLKEGLRTLDKNAGKSESIYESVSTVSSRQTWRQTLRCFFQIQLVFNFCTRTAWEDAQQHLQGLKDNAAAISEKPILLSLLIQYLDGMVNQGTGHLDIALSIFQRPCLSITTKPSSPAHMDLVILSTFNIILILHPSNHVLHRSLPALLSSLHPYLPRIQSTKPLLSAYNLILATTPNPDPPTIPRTKQHLQAALQAAKSVSSIQLQCITLNFMSYKFFKGLVGEQAEKSVRASENLARKGMDGLWRSVSAGSVGETLEMAGRVEEAGRVREMGREIARGLPEGVVQWEGEREGDGGGDVVMK